MPNDIQEISEVTSRVKGNNKIIAVTLVLILFLVGILYASVAGSKKVTRNYNLQETTPVLSFNETKRLDLIPSSEEASLSNQEAGLKNPTESEAEYVSHNNIDPAKNLDPEKLMEFKKIMDTMNEEQMREIIKRRATKTLVYTSLDKNTSEASDLNPKAKSFVDEVDKTTPIVEAVHTTNLSTSILEGTIIHATLETAVNSDLPGSMRAVISRPVYSADGLNKLLSPGDRLVMKYTSKVTKGAARIFAVGSRIIKADGISINLGSEVASPLGVVGVGADSVDTHFFERFGEATLLAVLSASAATMNVSDEEQLNSLSMYRSGIAESFADSAKGSLKQNTNLAPTLKIGQGKEITVFVAKDLNFDKVYSELL